MSRASAIFLALMTGIWLTPAIGLIVGDYDKFGTPIVFGIITISAYVTLRLQARGGQE